MFHYKFIFWQNRYDKFITKHFNTKVKSIPSFITDIVAYD